MNGVPRMARQSRVARCPKTGKSPLLRQSITPPYSRGVFLVDLHKKLPHMQWRITRYIKLSVPIMGQLCCCDAAVMYLSAHEKPRVLCASKAFAFQSSCQNRKTVVL